MPANLENSAVAAGLEKVSFHSNPKECSNSWNQDCWEKYGDGDGDDTTIMAESEELKNLLIKEDSEKVGLKFNSQKTKIMASGPITSWQLHGETVETVTDFTLGGSKITADGDCSHDI